MALFTLLALILSRVIFIEGRLRQSYYEAEKKLTRYSNNYLCTIPKKMYASFTETGKNGTMGQYLLDFCVDDLSKIECRLSFAFRTCLVRDGFIKKDFTFTKKGCIKKWLTIPRGNEYSSVYWMNVNEAEHNFECTFSQYIYIHEANFVYTMKCDTNPCYTIYTKTKQAKTKDNRRYFLLKNTKCKEGHWGRYCDNFCYCRKADVCERNKGNCNGECKIRYTPRPKCDTTCPENKWGVTNDETSCTGDCFCFNSEYCDVETGVCRDGECIKGYTAKDENSRCKKCLYGPNCVNQCHCQNNVMCDSKTGECPNGICHLRYYGKTCQETCPVNKYLQNGACDGICNCPQGVNCAVKDGQCHHSSCIPGYGGSPCKECSKGTFGLDCALACNCKDGAVCDRVTGKCPNGCDSRHYGEDCQRICPKGKYLNLETLECTEDCHCMDNNDCNLRTGECFSGMCANGWRISKLKCDERCFNDKDGGCTNPCRCWQGAACDYITGICPDNKCVAGWTGRSCQNRIAKSNSSALVAVAACIGVAILIALIAGLLYYKKRKEQILKQYNMTDLDNYIIDLTSKAEDGQEQSSADSGLKRDGKKSKRAGEGVKPDDKEIQRDGEGKQHDSKGKKRDGKKIKPDGEKIKSDGKKIKSEGEGIQGDDERIQRNDYEGAQSDYEGMQQGGRGVQRDGQGMIIYRAMSVSRMEYDSDELQPGGEDGKNQQNTENQKLKVNRKQREDNETSMNSVSGSRSIQNDKTRRRRRSSASGRQMSYIRTQSMVFDE